MKRILTTAAAGLIALATFAGAASAKPHDNHGQDQQRGENGYDQNQHDNGRHAGWHKGGRIASEDWGRGQRVDWRRHHLRQPPRGYEWRQVDNNYVLAAVAGGLIASIIANSR
ncbi:MAG: hypothetical protein JWP49_1835 [Phenylobacterium sp.]|nr:hypothetical protein [Phenylobacterium sp.]